MATLPLQTKSRFAPHSTMPVIMLISNIIFLTKARIPHAACAVTVFSTLRTELPFVFFNEEEKRRLGLSHVKPLKKPQPKLLDESILFSCFVKVDRNVYKTANKSVSTDILITCCFLAIGWRYLHDLSHTFLKRLKLL